MFVVFVSFIVVSRINNLLRIIVEKFTEKYYNKKVDLSYNMIVPKGY